jgi:hypothetical protein
MTETVLWRDKNAVKKVSFTYHDEVFLLACTRLQLSVHIAVRYTSIQIEGPEYMMHELRR